MKILADSLPTFDDAKYYFVFDRTNHRNTFDETNNSYLQYCSSRQVTHQVSIIKHGTVIQNSGMWTKFNTQLITGNEPTNRAGAPT